MLGKKDFVQFTQHQILLFLMFNIFDTQTIVKMSTSVESDNYKNLCFQKIACVIFCARSRVLSHLVPNNRQFML